MWCLLNRRVHWVCAEGEIDLKTLHVRAVTGAPRAEEDMAVVVGRGLLALERSVDLETMLLLETRASTMEPMLDGLRLACWRLRRLVTANGALFLEGRREPRRPLETWEMAGGSLELLIAHLLEQVEEDAVLVDPFACDLRSLRGAERAGLHSISIAASLEVVHHIHRAAEFALKVEVPPWQWLPLFLFELSRHGNLHQAARHAEVSPARVYQAMKEERGVRLVVNALRSGFQKRIQVRERKKVPKRQTTG